MYIMKFLIFYIFRTFTYILFDLLHVPFYLSCSSPNRGYSVGILDMKPIYMVFLVQMTPDQLFIVSLLAIQI